MSELGLDSLVVVRQRALKKGEDDRQLGLRLQRRRHRGQRETDAVAAAPALVSWLWLAEGRRRRGLDEGVALLVQREELLQQRMHTRRHQLASRREAGGRLG